MGNYIAKQPNGLLCRFSSVVDCITHYNYTEEDYIELCAERAREEARRNLQNPKFLQSFDRVLEDIRFDNISYDDWVKMAKEMGYEEPHWKFKPGDKVKIHSPHNLPNGHIGEVWKSGFNKIAGKVIVEVFIDALAGSWLFGESELDKV